MRDKIVVGILHGVLFMFMFALVGLLGQSSADESSEISYTIPRATIAFIALGLLFVSWLIPEVVYWGKAKPERVDQTAILRAALEVMDVETIGAVIRGDSQHNDNTNLLHSIYVAGLMTALSFVLFLILIFIFLTPFVVR